ncbi:MAG: hypothetical protein VST70_04510 [Nitrospirota bacterium]|nr:hypothetical protein [Nitrospirota bacterium]
MNLQLASPVMRGVYFVNKGIKIFQKLKSGGSVRCVEILALLKELGFVVRNGNKGGHKTFYHPKLTELRGHFDCGHSDRYEIKECYKKNILNIIEESEDLISVLNGGDDD